MSKQNFGIERGLNIDLLSIIPCSVVPDGTGIFAEVAINSIAFGSAGIYQKLANTNSPLDWVKLATTTDVGNTSNDWRESALVADLVSTTLPTGTATQTITIDGIVVSNGQRVLFSNLTGGGNVYTYIQSSGLFAEDSNVESIGDHVYVAEGTSGGKTYAFNAAGAWVTSNISSLDEEGYIRAFIGKLAAGLETPVYLNNYSFLSNDNLTTSISKLDARLNATAAGYKDAFLSTNVTSARVIDTLLADDYRSVKWMVTAVGRGVGDLDKVFTTELLAHHNGTVLADATIADAIVYGKLKTGLLLGLDVTVTITGIGAAQAMNLVVTSTTAVDVVFTREPHPIF